VNSELWGTNDAQGQMSEHIIWPNGAYYCPSNTFLLRCSLNIFTAASSVMWHVYTNPKGVKIFDGL